MPEDDDAKLKSLGVVYAAYDAVKRKQEWGYRAAYLAFASFLFSALAVLLLQLWQPVDNPIAAVLLICLFFFVSLTIAFGAFGQPTGKRKE